MTNLSSDNLFYNKNKKQKEFVQAFREANYNGKLYSATRVGKTKIVIDTIADYQPVNVLWVVPTVKLRDEGVKSEFIKWESDYSIITTACYKSLKKFKGRFFDMIVLDECHHVTPLVDSWLSEIGRNKLIGITATMPKDPEKLAILNKLAPTIGNYQVDEAVADKVIAPYKIIVIETSLDSLSKYIEAGNKSNRFMTTEKKQYQYLTDQFTRWMITKGYNPSDKKANMMFNIFMSKRANFLYTLKSKVEASKAIIKKIPENMKTLILSQRIEVANTLCENVYHSKDESGYDPFVKGEVNRLAACRALDEGVTLPNLDLVFIQQANSTTRQLTQRVGRALGLRNNHLGIILILMVKSTQDEKWVRNAITGFTNVEFVSLNRFLTEYDLSRIKEEQTSL